MGRKKSLFDHYLDAIGLLSRAEVHLEWYENDCDGPHQKEMIADLRSDISSFLKKKVPQ